MSQTNFLLQAAMDVDLEHEELFNEVYETEHIPFLSSVPGIGTITRYRRESFSMKIGGEVKKVELAGEPMYVAVYELEDPAVLTSNEWAEGVEQGRWPGEVRPFTTNRKHSLFNKI